ncbi:hypothetical protein AB4264_25470, partial [Vibrio sp. 10N.261.55.B8]|uniref:hypothetical protein n=1 Tax=Vibrio sp. 10N.261.55.B8 TaxID=3229688 RepID=UPI00354BD125
MSNILEIFLESQHTYVGFYVYIDNFEFLFRLRFGLDDSGEGCESSSIERRSSFLLSSLSKTSFEGLSS